MSDVLPVIYDTLSQEYTDSLDSLSNDEQAHNAEYIARVLAKYGATKDCILAILVNMWAESTINPRAMERKYESGKKVGYGPGRGLIQWSSSAINTMCARSPYGGSWETGGAQLCGSEAWKVAVECGLTQDTTEEDPYGAIWGSDPPAATIAEFGEPMTLAEFTSLEVGDTYHGGTVTETIMAWSYMSKREKPAIVQNADLTAIGQRLSRMVNRWNGLNSTVTEAFGSNYQYWLLFKFKRRISL